MKSKKIKNILYNLFLLIATISLLTSGVYAGGTILRPIEQGSYKGWTNVNCSEGIFEYQCVDEQILNISDYLYTFNDNTNSTNSSNKERESFLFGNISNQNATNITKVTLTFEAKWHNQTYYKTKPFVKINGTIYNGDVFELNSNYSEYNYSFNTNPATGQNWTINEINQLEA